MGGDSPLSFSSVVTARKSRLPRIGNIFCVCVWRNVPNPIISVPDLRGNSVKGQGQFYIASGLTAKGETRKIRGFTRAVSARASDGGLTMRQDQCDEHPKVRTRISPHDVTDKNRHLIPKMYPHPHSAPPVEHWHLRLAAGGSYVRDLSQRSETICGFLTALKLAL